MVKTIHNISKKVLLVIFDGFGINEQDHKNAIKAASTPNIDALFRDYPMTLIEAGGVSVGLPKGVSGNSEVGHMNLGAGRPVRQDLVRINETIENKNFSSLFGLQKLIKITKESSRRVHLMGLLSDGGVHSHIEHIKECINTLSNAGLDVFFHAFMDGRDTPKNYGAKYIKELQEKTKVNFASMQGRSIGMDRDRRWNKIELCYKTFTGKGHLTDLDPLIYLEKEYKEERFDEFIQPTLFNKDYAMKEDDTVFFINFRPDRAIQITLCMNDPKFDEFSRPWIPKHFLCMTPYVPDDIDLPILFDKEPLAGGLCDYLSSKGLAQYKIAETEKYAHITFFFNGGRKAPFENEQQVLVPSPKDVETYNQKPQMSAFDVTDLLIKSIEDDSHSFYLVNYANSDMVGHTGDFDAAVKAIETLDKCLKKLIQCARENNISLLLTADHGNSDQMAYPDGSPHTSHTGAPVPFVFYNKKIKNKKDIILNTGNHSLQDVAPTILNCLGLDNPESFTGKSIFK